MLLANRGLLARLFRGLFRAVERSWQMYPLGFLFGLGFDTATEVGAARHFRDARPRRACRSGRSWSFRPCSPPACR